MLMADIIGRTATYWMQGATGEMGGSQMSRGKRTVIEVRGAPIGVVLQKQEDYVSLTDIARFKNPDHTDDLIRNWLRNRNTVEFLGIWERLNNPSFNSVEFDGIKMQAGLNSFALTPKQWIERTQAVGIVSSAGRYGGTYAHTDMGLLVSPRAATLPGHTSRFPGRWSSPSRARSPDLRHDRA
jgi:hypothetical protein